MFASLLLIAVLALSIFFVEQPATSTAIFIWQRDIEDVLFAMPWLNYLLTVGLIALNAHQLNNLFNQNGFFPRATFLAGLMYVICLMLFDGLMIQFELLAHLFVIFSLMFIFQMRRQEPAKDFIFKASFLAGLAIVFSPMLAPLLLAPWISLVIFKPFIWREWLLAVLGLLLPTVYHYSMMYLLTSDTSVNITSMHIGEQFPQFGELQVVSLILFGLIVLVSAWRLLVIRTQQVVRFKKLAAFVFYLFVLTALSLVFGWFLYGQVVLTFIVPLAVVIAINFLNSRNETFANIVVVCWFIISGINLFIY